MKVKAVGEIVKRTDPILFVTWLNYQLKGTILSPIDVDSEFQLHSLEVDNLSRHLQQFLADELITVSGWLSSPDIPAVHTSWLFRISLLQTSFDPAQLVIRFECQEPALLAYCRMLMSRAQDHFPDGQKPSMTLEPVLNDNLKISKKSKGGRPRNPDDEWARYQVNKLKRPKTEVYKEWKVRIGPDRLRNLINPEDSFKKALKR